MRDQDCVVFLQWALPRLQMRWPGFRKVRRQVSKRVTRRLRSLGLADAEAYRAYLEDHAEEWEHLDGLCRISISRFFRDRQVYQYLADEVLPSLCQAISADPQPELRAWSIGCAAGEEVYTLATLRRFVVEPRFPKVSMRILGTDADSRQLERARAASYPRGSLKDIPAGWREAAFDHNEARWRLRPAFQAGVELKQQDIRRHLPDERFHLILCRNLVFTYFAEPLQRQIAAAIRSRLMPGGVLLLGKHESLPTGTPGFAELAPGLRILRAA